MKYFKHGSLDKMEFPFESKVLVLILQEGWDKYRYPDDEVADPLTFIKGRDSNGALQISLYSSIQDHDFDIAKHLEKNNSSNIEKIIRSKRGEWDIYEYEVDKDGFRVNHFQLVKPKVIVHVTYTSEAEDVNRDELEEARKIIASIEVIDKDNEK